MNNEPHNTNHKPSFKIRRQVHMKKFVITTAILAMAAAAHAGTEALAKVEKACRYRAASPKDGAVSQVKAPLLNDRKFERTEM